MNIDFLAEDFAATTAREMQGLSPLPLTVEQVLQLIQYCQKPPIDSIDSLKHLLIHRILPGANQAAYIKADFLSAVAIHKIKTPLLDPYQAIEILGTMWGGHNITVLSDLLDYPDQLAQKACHQLALNVFLFDTYYEILNKYREGHTWAIHLLDQWAQARWLKCKPSLPDCIKGTVFKLPAVVNAAMLSPTQAAWTRADIALHAQSFLNNQLQNAIEEIRHLQKRKQTIILVADEINLEHASSAHCEAAINVFSWIFGEQVPFFPNRAHRGIAISQITDKNFRKWMEYNGALSIQANTDALQTGDVVHVYPYQNYIATSKESFTSTEITQNQRESWRVGGYLNLQLGRVLTQKARHFLQTQKGISLSTGAANLQHPHYSLAQKMLGHACGVKGIEPGHHCEPFISIVEAPQISSRGYNKIPKLPAMGLSGELVIEPFQHLQAIEMALEHKGVVMLKAGDGMVHAWLNRLILPGEIGIGRHAYTSLVAGFAFSVEQALIPIATCTGTLPILMPESVLIRFSGEMQPGITIRDLVYAIPYVAEQKGLLIAHTQENVFSHRIIEITGLSYLTIEQGFEFNEASIDWGATACVIQFSHDTLKKHVTSGIQLLYWMIKHQYRDIDTLKRRIAVMQAWLESDKILDSDPQSKYAAVIDIDLNKITEPLVAALEAPQKVQPLTKVASIIIDEAFVGGSEISISSYRVVGEIIRNLSQPTKIPLWLTPASKLEALQLMREGYYALYADKGVHTAMPDNNLCMSTQLNHTGIIVATAKRAFLRNKMALKGYLCSPELTSVIATLGYLPSIEEYQTHVSILAPIRSTIDQPINFYA